MRSVATPWILLGALAAPAGYALLIKPLLLDSGMTPLLESLFGLLFMWATAGSVVALVLLGEHRPWPRYGCAGPR